LQIQIKKVIDLSAKDLGRIIGCASINIVFGKVPVAPGRIVSVEHGSEPSHANNTDHQSGDDAQAENIQVILFTFTTFTETISVE
jgi:hypothetical protein